MPVVPLPTGRVPRRRPPQPGRPVTATAETTRGSDFAALSRQVRATNLLQRRGRHYVLRISVTVLALVAPSAGFVLVGDSWYQLGIAAVLGVVFTQLAFLGHDAGHQQILPDPAGQRPARHRDRRPAGGAELRLVAGQAQPPPRQPQSRGARPGHRRVGPGLHHRARRGPHRWAVPAGGALPGLAVLPDAVLRGPATARGQRRVADQGPAAPLPPYRVAAAVGAPGGLPGRGRAGALAGQGAGLRRGAPGGLRHLHGLRVRPQPQGHGGDRAGRAAGLPAPAGADLPQRPRRLVHRPAAGWAELPDRAPPVPEHAAAQPAPRAAAGPPVLPGARHPLHRDQPVRLVPGGAGLPARSWAPRCARPGQG